MRNRCGGNPPGRLLECTVNHVVLSPKLPGVEEEFIDVLNDSLCQRLEDASVKLRNCLGEAYYDEWEDMRLLLQNCRVLNYGGKLSKSTLVDEFCKLTHRGLLILYVPEQNAGLLVLRKKSEQGEIVIFEAFEASPLSTSVLNTENALQCDFPGEAVVIPHSTFMDNAFQESLARFLEQASTECVKRFAAHVWKANAFTFEGRETADPSLITGMLMTFLEANGHRSNPKVLRKRVRDDVCFSKKGGKPWRRSPFWLVLRVGIQRHLCERHGGEAGRVRYKFLICLVLSRILDDAVGELDPEPLTWLKTKLCRRLAKLENDRVRDATTVRALYDSMFSALGPVFEKSIREANAHIELVWRTMKDGFQRQIDPLPRKAPQKSLYLSLPKSEKYLDSVLEWYPLAINTGTLAINKLADEHGPQPRGQLAEFTNQFYQLSEKEMDIRSEFSAAPSLACDPEATCLAYAERLERYLSSAIDSYGYGTEERSGMILCAMRIWVLMDTAACQAFPLLKDFSPGMNFDALNVLHLSHLSDMRDLRDIQLYLERRLTKCRHFWRTIFDDPAEGCFAEQYFDASQDSPKLRELQRDIEATAAAKREEKEAEWRRQSTHFEKLNAQIAEATCMQTFNVFGEIIHMPDCRKCLLDREAARMRIRIHEDPLPSKPAEAKAVIFEMACPGAFHAYRNATWKLMSSLGRSMDPVGNTFIKCRLLLSNYYETVRSFHPPSGVTLASTNKSFRYTHFKSVRFPVALEEVCCPNDLKLKYYDTRTGIWPGSQWQTPSFEHHCRPNLPDKAISAALLKFDPNGPSSYEVISSQTDCPPGINVHEFTALQTMLAGTWRRWMTILVELGSSNLNFSTDTTARLISHLALQVGPANECHLGTVHKVFGDRRFTERLLEQIKTRLDGISSNWRETNCMELMITLILRLCFLADDVVKAQAGIVLEKARAILSEWITQLRKQLRMAEDTATGDRYSRYSFLAALLCRRTFSIYVDSSKDSQPILLSAMQQFIECSITMQDSMIADPTKLPQTWRDWLVRDSKMVYRMRFALRRSLLTYPSCLHAAVKSVWPQTESDRLFSNPAFLDGKHQWWVRITLSATEHAREQEVLYHLLEGHLLVDGQPLGNLPQTYRQTAVIEQLFGKQMLLTYPSGFPGMSYCLAHDISGHQIHFGFRNGALVIHAQYKNAILELIPRGVFGTPEYYDLPASLVHNCVHWLNLQTGVLEIRPDESKWMRKKSHWQLNFNMRTAQRNQRSTLVDPHSSIFKRIAKLFDKFEHHSRLTVFQPPRGPLSVELRRMELSFSVSRNNLLECHELKAQIDPNQDAGTWYGLDSKLVLRDSRNHSSRSILIPMGELTFQKNDFHVRTTLSPSFNYGRFAINEVLGRLECATEPWLLFMKAYLHAATSFVLPDPLTGRTGTEEALHCLTSGSYQPWTPLGKGPMNALVAIAQLSPKREFYPPDSKKMQVVQWDPSLTVTIQNDAFWPIVDKILKVSTTLSIFTPQKEEAPALEALSEPKLRRRASWRQRIYQRPNAGFDVMDERDDMIYQSRDRFKPTESRQNTFEAVSLVKSWPSRLPTTPALATILQKWPNIKGLNEVFEKSLISDILDIDFESEWGPLVSLCRTSSREDKYRLMILFGLMAYRDRVDMVIVRIMIAFAILEGIKKLTPPKWPTFTDFRSAQAPSMRYLKTRMALYCLSCPQPDTDGLKLCTKTQRRYAAEKRSHDEKVDRETTTFAKFLLDQWPCEKPTVEGYPPTSLIDISKAMDDIFPEWLRLFQNSELSTYIDQVQAVLNLHDAGNGVSLSNLAFPEQVIYQTRCRGRDVPDLTLDLLCKRGPSRLQTQLLATTNGHASPSHVHSVSRIASPTGAMDIDHKNSRTSEILELEQIIRDMASSESRVQQNYASDLLRSLDALKKAEMPMLEFPKSPVANNFQQQIAFARHEINECFEKLEAAFEKNDNRTKWLKLGGLWPCITPVTLLEQLRSTSTAIFGSRMKESLVAYGVSITVLQRLLRLQDAYARRNGQSDRVLKEEWNNPGHTNWNPAEYPDWLLLEIDANMLIRPVQVVVALATIQPPSNTNSVLQMNMGQGKTSCIMPMVAAVLADSSNLTRLIVPKALLVQTAQLLQARLGGLVGREVRHIPFSRKTPTDNNTIRTFWEIHKEIKKSRGVILALPEHLMSFKLSGQQRLSESNLCDATPMINIQKWMKKECRDVLDESDFTLAVRTQLIYPSGSQMTVDGHPHRWQVAEELLHMVESHLWNLQADFPESIDVKRPQGRFPVVFFLRKDAEEALLSRLVGDIVRGQTSILPLEGACQEDRDVVEAFISRTSVSPEIVEYVFTIFPGNVTARKKVYLLRGLLVHRIFLTALKKRWNVQYGIDPARDPIAVPFHAKGVPSEQAEWGHPDVSILLTCLSFYFGGLQLSQLRESLEHLLKSDDPSYEYDRWTQSSDTLPDVLRDWNVINVEDEVQVADIWQHMRYQVVVIDYFLNQFVFPRHSKQFQVKLQTSGWDIPLFSAETKSNALTTGFSGTNDNKTMLPLTIKQDDLPELQHTNAEVLTYLLQPRNRQYFVAADENRKQLPEVAFLEKLKDMNISVLIDAGALILEMDNLTLARAWLKVEHERPGVLYFNSDNKPWVLTRHGSNVPFLASPFAEDLGNCLVYLDEAHTRGTDLKLPPLARGALTLGLGQTKDHTVQAAMRLRQLATSQSVVFFAPPEVHQSILDIRSPEYSNKPIDSSDVINWLLKQTCNGIEQIQPLYYSQGIDFCHRTQAALDNPEYLRDDNHRKAYCDVLKKTEKQSLAKLYKPGSKPKSSAVTKAFKGEVATFVRELNRRRKLFQDFGNAVHASALQEVEQEREVAFEVEAVREVQKPLRYQAMAFPGLHRDIKCFAETGNIPARYTGIEPALAALGRTALGKKYKVTCDISTSRLFVSREFSRTVKLFDMRPNDIFIRPVNWIVWSQTAGVALVVIPEEAELLIPILRKIERPNANLLTYAAPVTRKMLYFNDLKYYAIPSLSKDWKPPTWLTIELGILAGRTYFEFHEYENLCRYLNIKEDGETEHLDTGYGTISRLSTFQNTNGVKSNSNGDQKDKTTFAARPLTFLQEWLALRRRGHDFSHTPMGYVCQNKRLTSDYPFFAKPETNGVAIKPSMARAVHIIEEDSFLRDLDETENEFPQGLRPPEDPESDSEGDDEAGDGHGGVPGGSPPEEEESESSSSDEESTSSESESSSEEENVSDKEMDGDDEEDWDEGF